MGAIGAVFQPELIKLMRAMKRVISILDVGGLMEAIRA
jgi:hypothetical protein